MKNRNLGDSFKNALNGVIYTVKAERNMKLHILAALVVIFLGISYRLEKIETLVICLTISLVIVCEMFNTAIEVIVDLIVDSYHPKAKIAKDVAAGGVLLSAIMSVIIGYIIFIDKVSPDVGKIINGLKKLDIRYTLAALVLTILLAVLAKAIFKRRINLKVATDAAIALVSSLAAAGVLLWNGNVQNSIVFSGIAILVVTSRIKKKMQNIPELLAGWFSGFVIMLFVYQILMGA